jgi:proton glutamate symport protein
VGGRKTVSVKQFLRNPVVLFVFFILGIYTGIYHPEFSKTLSPFGNLYLSALKLVVIPIIITTVAASVAQITGSKQPYDWKRVGIVALIMLVIASSMGIVLATITRPGVIDISFGLATIINKSGASLMKELSLTDPIEPSGGDLLSGFLTDLLPNNIFTALVNSQILQIVIFSILFGLAVGFLRQEYKGTMTDILLALKNVFQMLINGVILLLPIGIYFLLADQFSRVTPEVIEAMLRFLFSACLTMFMLFFINTIIIWRRSSMSYWNSIYSLLDTIILAFSTQSSFAAMPSAIQEMTEKFKVDPTLTNSIMSLGITLCRYGNIIYFSFATIFIAQLYSVPLGVYEYTVILFASVLAGVMTAGATGIASLYMMTIILDPIGLPFGAVLILFIAIDPLIDPLRTLLIVHTNCAATMLIAKKPTKIAHA